MHHNSQIVATAVVLLIISSIEQSTAFIAIVDYNKRSSLPVQLAQSTISPIRRKRRNKQVLNYKYADEWVDCEELALHNRPTLYDRVLATTPPTKHSKRVAITKKPSFIKQLLHKLSIKWYIIKENIRTKLERYTVYVLECEEGKYYVGSTSNRKRRYNQHARRRGSQWTKTYAPLLIKKEYKRIPQKYLLGFESKVTAENMLLYGVNNVRGSMFCSTKDYHIGHLDALTKFIGHYNDLNYGKVKQRLRKVLPMMPEKEVRRKSRNTDDYDSFVNHRKRCYCCGKMGHIASSCPEKLRP